MLPPPSPSVLFFLLILMHFLAFALLGALTSPLGICRNSFCTLSPFHTSNHGRRRRRRRRRSVPYPPLQVFVLLSI